MADKGLKLTNKKSTVPIPPPNPIEALDKEASEAISRMEEYKKRSWDLGTKFKAIIIDKTLPDNKSPLSKDLEQDTLNKLSELANEINLDEAQPDAAGSVALCQLMMKIMLLQRDAINMQAFKIAQLEAVILEIKK